MYQALRLLHQHAWLCTTISKVSNTQKRTTVGSFSSHLSWRGDRTWHKHQKDCSAPPISNSYIRQFNLLELPWSRAFGAPVNRADAKYSRYLHGKNTFFFIKKEDYVNYILLHGSTGHEEKKKKKKKKESQELKQHNLLRKKNATSSKVCMRTSAPFHFHLLPNLARAILSSVACWAIAFHLKCKGIWATCNTFNKYSRH